MGPMAGSEWETYERERMEEGPGGSGREEGGRWGAAALGHEAFGVQPQPLPANSTSEASSRSMRVSEVGGEQGLMALARAMELIKGDEMDSALQTLQKGF